MNIKVRIIGLLTLLLTSYSFSQEKKIEQLDSVVITSSRIDLPFKENSRTIFVISSDEIQLWYNSPFKRHIYTHF